MNSDYSPQEEIENKTAAKPVMKNGWKPSKHLD